MTCILRTLFLWNNQRNDVLQNDITGLRLTKPIPRHRSSYRLYDLYIRYTKFSRNNQSCRTLKRDCETHSWAQIILLPLSITSIFRTMYVFTVNISPTQKSRNPNNVNRTGNKKVRIKHAYNTIY